MRAYLDLMQEVLVHGDERMDRTGVGTLSLFGRSLSFDLSAGFPAVTTKKLHFHSVITELLWFLRGSSNVAFLREHGVTIWDEWADENGDLGPIYGVQWRGWKHTKHRIDGDQLGVVINEHDQLAELIEEIRSNPTSRRLIMSAWNVGELSAMALPPCHILSQFYVADGKLSCQVYQRSADVFLGLPFNIASYAALTHLLAHVCGLKPGVLTMALGDVHLYKNHIEQAKEQLSREPKPLPSVFCFSPGARLSSPLIHPGDHDGTDLANALADLKPSDIILFDYRHHPAIKAPIAI